MAEQKIKVLHSRHFNIVHLFFIIFFIYMFVVVAKYMSKEDVKVCEVMEGSLTQNHTYTGYVLRDEKLFYSNKDGYLKCYLTNGDRAKKDSALFAIDETGEYINGAKHNSLADISNEQIQTIRKYLNHFAITYNGQNYSNVYSFKDQINTTLYGIEQENSFDDKAFQLVNTSVSGLVYYTLDGCEQIKSSDITHDKLENINVSYSRKTTGDKISKNTPVCKVIFGESWSVIIGITDTDAEYYKDKTNAKVALTDIDTTLNAGIKVYKDKDGNNLAKITLDEYISTFASDRIVSIRLIKPIVTGLKVPKSSIVANELTVIPVDFAYKDDENDTVKFLLKKETKNNSDKKTQFEAINLSISYVDEKYYYIDGKQLKEGDIIYRPDKEGNPSKDIFEVGIKKTLKGVYNVNKGYAIFEVVDILDENDSYCIIKGGTTYGLMVYDRIVLNSSSVSEDDLLY